MGIFYAHNHTYQSLKLSGTAPLPGEAKE